ncbi:hypothetical protein B0H17DRAFT_1207868 [Mycena rosella]|uniref:Uncharacterized protein n=1 Tax=Mycena rosella TaxID=1033263 RepID=A0AAD7G7G0_MYCRO|nr:hypothetical protein B0H17DRAFT_1207868 [Mycena rosella]
MKLARPMRWTGTQQTSAPQTRPVLTGCAPEHEPHPLVRRSRHRLPSFRAGAARPFELAVYSYFRRIPWSPPLQASAYPPLICLAADPKPPTVNESGMPSMHLSQQPISASAQPAPHLASQQPARGLEEAPFPLAAIDTFYDCIGSQMAVYEGSDAGEKEDSLFAGGDEKDSDMDEGRTSLAQTNGIRRKLVMDAEYMIMGVAATRTTTCFPIAPPAHTSERLQYLPALSSLVARLHTMGPEQLRRM